MQELERGKESVDSRKWKRSLEGGVLWVEVPLPAAPAEGEVSLGPREADPAS